MLALPARRRRPSWACPALMGGTMCPVTTPTQLTVTASQHGHSAAKPNPSRRACLRRRSKHGAYTLAPGNLSDRHIRLMACLCSRQYCHLGPQVMIPLRAFACGAAHRVDSEEAYCIWKRTAAIWSASAASRFCRRTISSQALLGLPPARTSLLGSPCVAIRAAGCILEPRYRLLEGYKRSAYLEGKGPEPPATKRPSPLYQPRHSAYPPRISWLCRLR